MHFLRKPLVFYDRIYYYCPSENQDKLVDLKEVMNEISEQLGYQVLEFPENIPATNEYPQENRKVAYVVFSFLKLAGGAMTGDLDLGSNRIMNLAALSLQTLKPRQRSTSTTRTFLLPVLLRMSFFTSCRT